ncbi:stalk domain-containing protein [Anaerovorax odorimutans]|uniref:stalk domain-containing protein n=1 Tax=Anaerovorax odorimutans TaxID=109327 RepID=UPI0003FF67B9|nr:stalk domain-containing protein [Anaerovorax odorimutans]
MRKLISTIMSFIFIIIWTAPVFAMDIEIDGQQVKFNNDYESPFVDEANRMQVPFRAVMEQFGATVHWDEEGQVAIAEKNGIRVEIPIGKNYIYKNSEIIPNDTAAIIKDNRTYLPIRCVLEAFGASVRWDENKDTVVVLSNADNIMYIHFIDVGQGDSIFIDYNDFEILIDGGMKNSSKKVIEYIKPYLDGDLDLVLATHEHQDHIGGLIDVLKAYEVDEIIDNGRTASTDIYKEYISAVNSEPNCNYLTVTDTAIDMGNRALFKILPMDNIYDTPNENSIVSYIDYNNVKVLFMGDLETTVERDNLDKFFDVDVLKVGHHGSRTATSQEFLDIVKPEVSIISAGIDNDFYLPNENVISRLLQAGSSLYGTFRSGDIIMSTDGTTYSFNVSNNLTANDAGAIEEPSRIYTLNRGTVSEREAVYIGNIKTKKFHTLDCRAGAKIADRNVVFFKSREDAVKEGYKPCKICNP